MDAENDAAAIQPTAVVSYWKELDLETLRGKLDEQGFKVAEFQESTVKSRKALAERTKDFKRSVAPDVMKAVAPLLKSYQEEVDRLTTRAKHGEGVFLDVYKRLYEAPDPAPVLATGLEFASRVAELESEVSSLSQELGEYRAESKELKNQDLTIRRLEDKIRTLEADLIEKDKSLEEALKGAAADTERRLAEEAQKREERLQVELTAAQAELETVRRAHQATQSQLFNVQERSGEEAATALAAAERAEEEMARVQDWVAALEAEKELLLQRIRTEKEQHGQEGSDDQGMPSDSTGQGSSLGAGVLDLGITKEELKAQRALASRLQSDFTALQERAQHEAAVAAEAQDKLKAALAAKETHCAALEAELSSRPTVKDLEEVRQQARILRALVHGSEDEDTDGKADGYSAASTKIGLPGSVEAALLAKSRHLEHKLTMTRLELAEAQGEAETAAAKASELESEIERQKKLIAQLEDDLLSKVTRTGGVGNVSSDVNQTTAGLLDGNDTSQKATGRASGMSQDTIGSDSTDMVAVLCAQRDRSREKVTQLETALAALNQQLLKSKADTEAARSDNLALVERLRYVQGYSGGGGAGKKVAGGDLESGGEVVGRYMKEYEERMNPFSDFRAREKEARRSQLPLQDKAAYALTSLLSGNKTTRLAVLIYALVLHFGVFLLLAGMSHRHADSMEALEEACAKAAGTAGTLPGATTTDSGGGSDIIGRLLL